MLPLYYLPLHWNQTGSTPDVVLSDLVTDACDGLARGVPAGSERRLQSGWRCTPDLLILHEQGMTMHAGPFAIASLLSGRKPSCARNAKTGARQHGRGRFHLLLPAVGVTTQRQASAGGEQLRHYSPSWSCRSLSMTAVLSIHGTSDGSLVTSYGSTRIRGIQACVRGIQACVQLHNTALLTAGSVRWERNCQC
jgi:hypothetical protein